MWNRIEQGDNLDIMRTLPDASVDLIYCDILYGTGRDFGDYKDLPAKRDVIDAFYRPRLQEMHRLLKETGSIYLQMDTKINHWMRCLMDEIFGYHCFLNEISWCYKTINKTKRPYARKHDCIEFYSKSMSFVFSTLYHDVSPVMLERWGSIADDNGDIPYEKLTPYDQKFFNREVYEKKPKNIYRGSSLRDWWDDISDVNRGANPEIKDGKYSTQKSEALLERIVMVSSLEGDVVADFFCGSGTTPAVAKRFNRQYFACDISERAIEITRKRLERVEPERQQKLFVNEKAGYNKRMNGDKNPRGEVLSLFN